MSSSQASPAAAESPPRPFFPTAAAAAYSLDLLKAYGEIREPAASPPPVGADSSGSPPKPAASSGEDLDPAAGDPRHRPGAAGDSAG